MDKIYCPKCLIKVLPKINVTDLKRKKTCPTCKTLLSYTDLSKKSLIKVIEAAKD